MKTCIKCGELKQLEEFYPVKSKPSQFYTSCKACWSKRAADYYKRNRDALLKSGIEWRKNNRDKVNAAVRRRREKDPAKFRAAFTRWSKNNPGYGKKYIAKRRKADPGFRISLSLRSRISGAIRNKGVWKSEKTKDLLGCSFEDFLSYLETLFKPGMSWLNYGEWHLDHIKPCAVFDLTDLHQQKECFHYTNLQPLWAIENLKKGAKWKNTSEVTKG